MNTPVDSRDHDSVSLSSNLVVPDDQPKSCFQRCVAAVDACCECLVNVFVAIGHCVVSFVLCCCMLCHRTVEENAPPPRMRSGSLDSSSESENGAVAQKSLAEPSVQDSHLQKNSDLEESMPNTSVHVEQLQNELSQNTDDETVSNNTEYGSAISLHTKYGSAISVDTEYGSAVSVDAEYASAMSADTEHWSDSGHKQNSGQIFNESRPSPEEWLEEPSPLADAVHVPRMEAEPAVVEKEFKYLYPKQYWDDETGPFQVRAENYIAKNKKPKIDSESPVFKLEGVQLFKTGKNEVYHISEYKQSLASQILRQDEKASLSELEKRDVFVVHINVHSDAYYSLAYTFSADGKQIKETSKTPFGYLWKRFKKKGNEGDQFRDKRFKVIPKIKESKNASWIFKTALSFAKLPSITGNKISQKYFSERNCLEVCMAIADLAGSGIFSRVTNTIVNAAQQLDDISLAFVIQGELMGFGENQELPERPIGTARIKNPVIEDAIDLEFDKKRQLTDYLVPVNNSV